MQQMLRNHPKLKWRGISTWPPRLGGPYAPGEVLPDPEETTLADVELIDLDFAGPRRLAIWLEFSGRRHAGQIWADDPEVVDKLYNLLKLRKGRPLREISNEQVDL